MYINIITCRNTHRENLHSERICTSLLECAFTWICALFWICILSEYTIFLNMRYIGILMVGICVFHNVHIFHTSPLTYFINAIYQNMCNRKFLVPWGFLLIHFISVYLSYLFLSFLSFPFLSLSCLGSFSLSPLFHLLFFFLIFWLAIGVNPRTIHSRWQQQWSYDGWRDATISWLFGYST